jgi:hypothetical protein
VSSIELNHELVDVAKPGDEVSVKIENTTGDAPKMYGRHFTHTDPLMSRVSIYLFATIHPCYLDKSPKHRCLQTVFP